MTRIVAIHSFRGGTGKSNIAANCASILAQAGARVAVIDTDVQSPGIHALFHLDQDELPFTLNDYLWDRCPIERVAYDVSACLNGRLADSGQLYLVPASLKIGAINRVLQEGYHVERLNLGFRALIKALNLDYLLIDTHPGVNEETLLSIAICHTLLLVLRPDQQDYQGVGVALEVAHKLHVPRVCLIINKVVTTTSYAELRRQAENVYGCPVVAVMPLAAEVAQMGSADIFCLHYPEHPFSKGIESIVAYIKRRSDEMLAMWT
jgi:MinD-like ATPase involved in chromosome partitioning or flagellar assembly